MRLGVFTPLLSQIPLEGVLAKLKSLQIDTIELGTGNYPGNAHCDLSMLENASALKKFKCKLQDHGAQISALSCHGNPLHPDPSKATEAQEVNRKTILLAEELGVKSRGRFLRLPRRLAECQVAQLGHLPVATGVSGRAGMAVG